MDKKKKCIAKNCEDCRLYLSWDMTDEKGLRKQIYRCGLFVLFDEIPKIRGAIDGLQGGVNEARNRSIETKEALSSFGNATIKVLEIANRKPRLISEGG